MNLLMTRRTSLVALAGLASGFLVSEILAGSVSAQGDTTTKTRVKEKAKATMKKGQVKWESLTPEQQAHAKETLKADAEQAKAKWESLTPERQQELVGKGAATVQRGRKKYQSLPK